MAGLAAGPGIRSERLVPGSRRRWGRGGHVRPDLSAVPFSPRIRFAVGPASAAGPLGLRERIDPGPLGDGSGPAGACPYPSHQVAAALLAPQPGRPCVVAGRTGSAGRHGVSPRSGHRVRRGPRGPGARRGQTPRPHRHARPGYRGPDHHSDGPEQDLQHPGPGLLVRGHLRPFAAVATSVEPWRASSPM